MVIENGKAHAPGGKISEAFLEFASPLIEATGPEAGSSELEPILKLAFTTWNAVVVDSANGNTRFVDAIRQSTATDPGAAALVEQMLSRKRLVFAHDDRLIGNYELYRRDGEWVLRAEARDPMRGSR